MIDSQRSNSSILANSKADSVKRIRKLFQRCVRYETKQFLVEGPQTVREALLFKHFVTQKVVVRSLYVLVDLEKKYSDIISLALAAGIFVQRINDEVLDAISSTVNSQGILAVCDFVDVKLEHVLQKEPKLVAILSQLRDPGNAGTVLRAADAAGAGAVVFTNSSVDVYNLKTVRATVGSLFHLPIVVGVDLFAVLASLKHTGFGVLAADGSANNDLDYLVDVYQNKSVSGECLPYDLSNKTAWVFGNEAWGLPDSVLDEVDLNVAVPLYGKAESLNVATAATVCLYASARAQR